MPVGMKLLAEKWSAVWKDAIARNRHTHQPKDIEGNIVDHLQTTLARASFNADDLRSVQAFLNYEPTKLYASMYQSTALTVRDELIRKWNVTQTHYTQKAPKRVYYLSLEFLMGKSLDNALLNLSAKKEYSESIKALGFNMEDLLDSERDAGLGNGGLGRLAG